MTSTVESAGATLPMMQDRPLGRSVSRLPVGWPFYAMFYGYPLWWVLGLQAFIWPILAAPMLLYLLRTGQVRAPRGFGLWLAFLLWMVASAVQLDNSHRYLSFAYRGVLYLSATVVLLYLFAISHRLTLRRIALPLGFLCAATIVGGYLAYFLPHTQFRSPVEILLPGRIATNSLIFSLVHTQFADVTKLLGFSIPRSQAPFNYTNEWGSNLAILIPLGVYSLSHVRRRVWRVCLQVLLLASVVPIITSINRGLWLSLGVGLLYVVVRLGLRGRVRLLAGTLLVLALATSAIVFSPLATVVSARFTHSNTQGRASLYQQATDSVLTSPVLGHGAPLANEEATAGTALPSVGTHGQLWTLLVSQGFPGTVLFIGFYVAMFLTTWRVSNRGLWAHAAILIVLTQFPFYNLLPVQIFTVAVAIVLCWRDVVETRTVTAHDVQHKALLSRRRPESLVERAATT